MFIKVAHVCYTLLVQLFSTETSTYIIGLIKMNVAVVILLLACSFEAYLEKPPFLR